MEAVSVLCVFRRDCTSWKFFDLAQVTASMVIQVSVLYFAEELKGVYQLFFNLKSFGYETFCIPVMFSLEIGVLHRHVPR